MNNLSSTKPGPPAGTLSPVENPPIIRAVPAPLYDVLHSKAKGLERLVLLSLALLAGTNGELPNDMEPILRLSNIPPVQVKKILESLAEKGYILFKHDQLFLLIPSQTCQEKPEPADELPASITSTLKSTPCENGTEDALILRVPKSNLRVTSPLLKVDYVLLKVVYLVKTSLFFYKNKNGKLRLENNLTHAVNPSPSLKPKIRRPKFHAGPYLQAWKARCGGYFLRYHIRRLSELERDVGRARLLGALRNYLGATEPTQCYISRFMETIKVWLPTAPRATKPVSEKYEWS